MNSHRRGYAILALLLLAPAAHAGTLNLRWNACLGDGGVMNKSFACDTNAGFDVLVGSFFTPYPLSEVTGIQIAVDIGFAGTTIPPWWDLRYAGTCRQNALSFSPSSPASATTCTDWASGTAVGGVASYLAVPYYPISNMRRILAASAAQANADLVDGQEYAAFQLIVSHQKTVGAGSCPGCLLGACIYFRGLEIQAANPANDLVLSPGSYSGSTFDALATWQGGAGVIQTSNGNLTGCPAATPTRIRTWGEVKTLYR